MKVLLRSVMLLRPKPPHVSTCRGLVGSVVPAFSFEPGGVCLDRLHELEEDCGRCTGGEWGVGVVGIDGMQTRLVLPLRWERLTPGVQLAGDREPPAHAAAPLVILQRVLELEIL